MSAEISLTVTKGKLSGKSFAYNEKALLVLGRMDDCSVVLPEKTVSRYHCMLDVAPPAVMVRDFGSLNGTYLNGKKIGQRGKGVSAEEARKDDESRRAEFLMNSGDRLGLGSECEITLEVKRVKEEAQAPQAKRKCGICGATLPGENGPDICESCQTDDSKMLDFIVKKQAEKTGGSEDIAGYRRIRELGKGGMGQVWLVEEEATGKKMALKLMLPQVAANERMWTSFMREASICGQLDHRNIVKQYERGRTGDVFFMVMELCDGGSADALISKRGGKLSVDLATNITLQVLEGLIYAHSAPLSAKMKDGSEVKVKGIVHRDLKPHNIFLTGNGKNLTAKIGDFGLAKSFENAGLSGFTVTGGRAGTPVFMPRQQASNYKYAKPPVDVWATAATYYYMLTGNYPKDYSKGGDFYYIALTSDAIPIRKRNPSIPKKLAEVIDRALVEKPDIGVQSAAEFKKMIKGAL